MYKVTDPGAKAEILRGKRNKHQGLFLLQISDPKRHLNIKLLFFRWRSFSLTWRSAISVRSPHTDICDDTDDDTDTDNDDDTDDDTDDHNDDDTDNDNDDDHDTQLTTFIL